MKQSEPMEIAGEYIVTLLNVDRDGYKDLEYEIVGPDGSKEQGTTGNDGKIEGKDLIPGSYHIMFKRKDKE